MKKAKIVFVVTGFLSITAILTLNLLAAEGVAPVIRFEAAGASPQESLQEFPTVYRGEVTFTHEKHIQLSQGDCGRCHHDGDGEPVTDMDGVIEAGSCADCHPEAGLVRGSVLDSASLDEVLEHTPNAMHTLCVGCHKKSNNGAHALNAPESCRGCHKKVTDK